MVTPPPTAEGGTRYQRVNRRAMLLERWSCKIFHLDATLAAEQTSLPLFQAKYPLSPLGEEDPSQS